MADSDHFDSGTQREQDARIGGPMPTGPVRLYWRGALRLPASGHEDVGQAVAEILRHASAPCTITVETPSDR